MLSVWDGCEQVFHPLAHFKERKMPSFPRILRFLCRAGATLSTTVTIGGAGVVTLASLAAGPAYAYCDGMRIAPVEQKDSLSQATIVQRVVLYEESSNDPVGKQFPGTVMWRTEIASPGPGYAPDIVVRADIDIPERRTTVKWLFRRNVDKTLPASHTVEIIFTPADFRHGGISTIAGLLMNQAAETRGVPLKGVSVKVTTGVFLIGLSSVESDLQSNVQFLKERAWFDIPIVYNDGRCAILAIEKGSSGERAFGDAFAKWQSDNTTGPGSE
jgi:hypothetical protein